MNAYIFDIDGVIADPVSKAANTDVLKQVIKILEKEDFVALNTGRSFSWTEEKILTPILTMAQSKNMFTNMFVVCEKGNVLAHFKNDAFLKQVLDDPLPEDLQVQMKKLADEFSDSLFYDDSKETMISFEMKEGFDIEKFQPIVKDLEEKVNEILIKEYVDYNLRIDPSHIALDIQYEDAGKHLGAERIEDFMLTHGIRPDTIYMIGDSAADSEMAEELQDKYPVTFVFVGEKQKLDTEKLTCEIVYPEKKYTEGTIEFLQKQR